MTTCECGHGAHAHDHEGIPGDWCVWCTCDGMSRPPIRPADRLRFLLGYLVAAALLTAAVIVMVTA